MAASIAGIDDLSLRVGGPDLIAWHHNNDVDVSTLRHVHRYRVLRAQGMAGSEVIYLDTNFWIGIRDAELKKRGTPWSELLRALRERVRSRRSICVTQQWSFYEVAKQSPESLRVSAQLIDELCEGVAIAPIEELRFWDVGHFVSAAKGWPCKFDGGRWTWIGQLLKSSLPRLPADLQGIGKQVVEKALIDTLYNAHLSDIFAQVGWETRLTFGLPMLDEETIANLEARKLRERKFRLTRDAVRLHEFRSILKNTSYSPIFREHVRHANGSLVLGMDDEAIASATRELIEKAVEDFRRNALGNYLPEASILTELYTLWERGPLERAFTVNDFYDWNHAAVALPLCNVFLTESHLAAQLRQLGADERYACRIINSPGEALSALNEGLT